VTDGQLPFALDDESGEGLRLFIKQRSFAMRYRAVLLDLDNTLYDYNACYAAGNDAVFPWLEGVTGRTRAELEPVYREAKRRNHVALAGTAASHNRLLYYQRLAELLGLKVFGTADTMLGLFWEAFFSRMEPFPGACELLRAVRPAGICLVTDMTVEIQYRKIERLGIGSLIDTLVTSEEAGREKPHPWPFTLALSKLGARPDEACMAGDDFTKDVEGPLLAGIDAYWVRQRASQHEPLFAHPRLRIVHDLVELKEALLVD